MQPPPALADVLKETAAYPLRLLVLPSGQLLLSDGTSQLWTYTPSGSPEPSWRPVILSIKQDASGTFTLTGTQLNGISEGAAYGDDAQMATNYPIIKLMNPKNGTVYFARTFDWSSTGVATGSTKVTTEFTLPPSIATGIYRLSVIANGISSKTVCVQVS